MSISLSGLDKARFDIGRTGTFDFDFDDFHTDSEVNTENFENDEDVRGDDYYTGSFADTPLVTPSLEDASGTDQTSTLINEMVNNNYIRVKLIKNNGESITLDKTKVKVSQNTESNIGNLDVWNLMFRDVQTNGPFYWN